MLFVPNQLIEHMVHQVPQHYDNRHAHTSLQEKVMRDIAAGKESDAFLNLQSITNEILPS